MRFVAARARRARREGVDHVPWLCQIACLDGSTAYAMENDSGQVHEITDSGDPEEDDAAAAVSSGRLLGRAEAARLLGVSKSTLRRMEGEQLEPVVGPKNVRLFHEEHVQSLVVTRRTGVSESRAPGDVAADAFDLFDRNFHPVEVVKHLRIAPDFIESLHRQWARLRGLLILSSDSATRMRDMLCDGTPTPVPLHETALLEVVRTWVFEQSLRQCEQCRNESAAFCRVCAKEWGLRAAKRDGAIERLRRL